MFSVLLQFFPIALAAITPTMVIFVTAILPTPQGFARAVGTVAGRFTAHLLLAILFTFILSFAPEIDENRTIPDYLSLVLFLAGVVLLIAAVWVLMRTVDPDKPPTRIQEILNRIGPVQLFVANVVIVLFSLRLMSLVIAGAAIIKAGDLTDLEEAISIVVLAIVLVWPMLIPLGVYIAMGDRREEVLTRMSTWLSDHSTAINVAVLTLFGGALVATGISGLS